MTESNHTKKQPTGTMGDPPADRDDVGRAKPSPGGGDHGHPSRQDIAGGDAAGGDSIRQDDIEVLIGELIAEFHQAEKSISGDGPQQSRMSSASTSTPGAGDSTASGSDDENSPVEPDPLAENDVESIARRLAPASPDAGPRSAATLRSQSIGKRVSRFPTIGAGTAIGVVVAVIVMAGIIYPMAVSQPDKDATVEDVVSDERSSLQSASSTVQENDVGTTPEAKSEARMAQLADDAAPLGQSGSGSNVAVEHQDDPTERAEAPVTESGTTRIQRTERPTSASTTDGDGAMGENGARPTVTVSGPATIGEASDTRTNPGIEPATTGALGDTTADARHGADSTLTEIPTTTTAAKTDSEGGSIDSVETAPIPAPSRIENAGKSDPAQRPQSATAQRQFVVNRNTAEIQEVGGKRAPVSAASVEELITRGQEKLKHGDIAAARLLFHRAFLMGDMRGAKGLATTFDPNVLETIPAVWFTPDPARSEFWYAKARELAESDKPSESKSVD